MFAVHHHQTWYQALFADVAGNQAVVKDLLHVAGEQREPARFTAEVKTFMATAHGNAVGGDCLVGQVHHQGRCLPLQACIRSWTAATSWPVRKAVARLPERASPMAEATAPLGPSAFTQDRGKSKTFAARMGYLSMPSPVDVGISPQYGGIADGGLGNRCRPVAAEHHANSLFRNRGVAGVSAIQLNREFRQISHRVFPRP